MEPIEKKIIDYLAEGPQSFKDLVRSFEIAKEDRDRFKKVVKVMVAEGALIKTRGGRFGLPSKMNLTTGRLSCHPDGFGFVKPEEGGADVYVNARRLSGAMHGDTVAARIEGIKSGGRREGSVLRIIKRAHKTVVGRFEKARGVGILTPSDEKLLYQIIIPKEEFGNAADGQIVIAEITRWPARNLAPMGRVVEVIGNPDDPDVEAEVILKKYGLPHRFPAEVLHEVLSVPSSVSQAEIAGRTDLRARTTVTIDGETAKDFDDAVSIERTAHGYRLWVSIADVSHYVREGTAIDSEAYARGTSVYFPDRAIPMLPEALSNGICSLNPQVERLTMTAELEFDARGSVVGKSFYESVIKSAERMTYTNVKKLIRGEDAEIEKRYSRILPDIKIMAELAKKLAERRMEAGSIDFDLPEPQIIIDLKGNVEDIVRSERNEAHKLIEEFMLAANKAVAGEFSSRAYPFVYRVHEEPDADSIHDFAEFASSFGLRFKDGLGPLGFQQVLKAVEGRPEEKLINQVLLRSMKQAVYSEVNVGHFGLAFKDYTHFTSPIRRYPDLVVHRLLKLLIHGKYTAETREQMESALPPVCGHTSARERKAMEAEREIADLKKTQFMSDKVGEAFEGLISGVTSFGIFVELKDYFVEGLVHVSTLLDDYYIFDEKKHSLIGERKKRVFRLGDAVSIKVTRADVERRRIDLVLDEAFADKPRKQGGQRPRESGGRGSKKKR